MIDGYTFRDQYPAVYQAGRATVSTLEVWRDGVLVAPSAGTCTITSPTGATTESPAVSIVSDVATMTVAAITTPDEGYREKWDLTIDGVVYTKYREAVVARSPLRCPIADLDLTNRVTDLSRNRGTMTTSFQSHIDSAWAEMMRRLRNTGEMPQIIVSDSALYDPALHLTLHLIYQQWYGQSGADHFQALAQTHFERYEAAWQSMSYTVDRDEDGTADDQNRESGGRGAIVHPAGSPLRSRRFYRLREW